MTIAVTTVRVVTLPHVIYSVNVFLKQYLMERFRGDRHYVWCSDSFDPSANPRFSSRSLVPPSSSPADLYRALAADVKRGDLHSPKINEQRASFMRLAVEWEKDGTIGANDKDEIVYWAEKADMQYWRPLIYVIPTAPILSRIQEVPVGKRAGLGMEYIVPDLRREEFDLLEI
jgi:hypothetical protein